MLELIKDKLEAKFGEGLVSTEQRYDFPVFEVKKEVVHDVLHFLKNDPELNFHFLTTMCGLHFPDNKGKEMGLMYQLHNMPKNWRIRIQTFMPTDNVEVPTVSDIWESANWQERETYDFFGFKFVGHPNLKRIMNMEEMNYHPLLKQYPLEDMGRTDKDDKFFGR